MAVVPASELQISESIHYVYVYSYSCKAFWVKVSLRFTHLVGSSCGLLLLVAVWYSIVWTHRCVVIHPAVDEHFHCFQCGDIAWSSALYVLWNAYIHLAVCIARSGAGESQVLHMLAQIGPGSLPKRLPFICLQDIGVPVPYIHHRPAGSVALRWISVDA